MIKPLIAGNWKMNQNIEQINAFFEQFSTNDLESKVDVWLAPQAIHLSFVMDKVNQTEIKVGAQNCSEYEDGAYTGETSALSLAQLGVFFTLVGHSERRQLFGEKNDQLNLKIKQAMKHNLQVIYCLGETLEQREQGKTLELIKSQLIEGLSGIDRADTDKLTIAYEPIWAIGTGKTATPEMAEEVHAHIHAELTNLFGEHQLRILYGGSVRPGNISDLMQQKHINGALVGGASLKGADFKDICRNAK